MRHRRPHAHASRGNHRQRTVGARKRVRKSATVRVRSRKLHHKKARVTRKTPISRHLLRRRTIKRHRSASHKAKHSATHKADHRVRHGDRHKSDARHLHRVRKISLKNSRHKFTEGLAVDTSSDDLIDQLFSD